MVHEIWECEVVEIPAWQISGGLVGQTLTSSSVSFCVAWGQDSVCVRKINVFKNMALVNVEFKQ